ncbi:hypothetical protein BO79DRAFT_255442 [Aspergillus costaricaensis CBS 115574]|uniref:Uncharacterized protein n=1 Tax=Aspergillus costaricaensis CBS 115574 TaxID=1448317 RepID=A0ACD1ID72_9EURO|nr:hypothetical protein BO79DRAFT_255442 [Aspergillus costaricaensis CBS 115574]RAK88242.1 hypothetical protein BO79DRAFT_255442 [Aspergillus costaricaensis CBS 115574]
MSLVTGDISLTRLWEDAQAPGDEGAVVRLWSHLFMKHLFSGKDWVVFYKPTSENCPRQRLDITIEHYDMRDDCVDVDTMAFCVYEPVAMDPSLQDLDGLKRHAFAVCMAYLLEHPKLSKVYVFTAFGTKFRVWSYSREDEFLVPLFGSVDGSDSRDYVDIHSPEASRINGVVQLMKNECGTHD